MDKPHVLICHVPTELEVDVPDCPGVSPLRRRPQHGAVGLQASEVQGGPHQGVANPGGPHLAHQRRHRPLVETQESEDLSAAVRPEHLSPAEKAPPNGIHVVCQRFKMAVRLGLFALLASWGSVVAFRPSSWARSSVPRRTTLSMVSPARSFSSLVKRHPRSLLSTVLEGQYSHRTSLPGIWRSRASR